MLLAKKFVNIISKEEERRFIRDLESFDVNQADIFGNPTLFKQSPLNMWKCLEDSYPTMARLAKAILVLPHSTVNVERLFSETKDIKTCKQNRILTENLETLLLIYQRFGEKTTEISEAMLQNYDNIWEEEEEEALSVESEDINDEILSDLDLEAFDSDTEAEVYQEKEELKEDLPHTSSTIDDNLDKVGQNSDGPKMSLLMSLLTSVNMDDQSLSEYKKILEERRKTVENYKRDIEKTYLEEETLFKDFHRENRDRDEDESFYGENKSEAYESSTGSKRRVTRDLFKDSKKLRWRILTG